MEIPPKFLNFLRTFWNPDDFITVHFTFIPISLLPALKFEIFLSSFSDQYQGGLE